MTRRHTLAQRLAIRTPLARWGFSVLAAIALLNGLLLPGLACTIVAAYAWKKR
ncbi:hypothetical protein ACKI14_02560 [Streptomyces turgidiscabies]|uniref:hypothetical protein n=1 Tax=Streptomyces turgidiscabies TaxID=85558 RepID=UPI0038F805A5